MKVVMLAAGAGGMYCGSCLRDNRLAATLKEQGRDLTLIPLYTPLRSDEPVVAEKGIHYGGINVYLNQAPRLSALLPSPFRRILNTAALLRLAGRLASSTSPRKLGPLAVSVLRGVHGPQRRETDILIRTLRSLKPDIVHLPNLLFLGLAAPIKSAGIARVVCSLSGEDVFIEQLLPKFRKQCVGLIREAAREIDGFIAPTDYYAGRAANDYALPPNRITTIATGIRASDFQQAKATDSGRVAAPPNPPFTIGYLARICPEKGLDRLCRAFAALHDRGHSCRLRIAGFLSRADRRYLNRCLKPLSARGLQPHVDLLGEVTRDQKIRFLASLHVLSVPAAFPEAKGLYCLEALAAGTPIVQPRQGAYPEIVERTGGGLLYESPTQARDGNVTLLADALESLITDEPKRRRLADAGRSAVFKDFRDDIMAENTWTYYQSIVSSTA